MVFFARLIILMTLNTMFAEASNQDINKINYSPKDKASTKKMFRSLSKSPNKDVGRIVFENISIECAQDGYPTIDALKKLMLKDFFLEEENKAVLVEVISGGVGSAKIYAVYVGKDSERAVLFLKISKKKEAIQNLKQIQEGFIGRKVVESMYMNKHLPVIVLVEKIYTYSCNNIVNSIEVIHGARGLPVVTIFSEESMANVCRCSYALGLALGSFQQIFMIYTNVQDPSSWKTVAHNDLHAGNVFFDAKTSKVYFIDNETMQENCSIAKDIVELVANLSEDMGEFMFEHDTYKFKKENWDSFLNSFFCGYVQSYDESKRPLIENYLKHGSLKNFFDKELSFITSCQNSFVCFAKNN